VRGKIYIEYYIYKELKNKMLRKFWLPIFVLGCSCLACFKTSNNVVFAEEGAFYAEYVSVTNAPQIDGELDEVWQSADSRIVTGTTSDGTSGSVKILWNETGIYYYATVLDSTVNDRDKCNLWVSEKYIDQDSYDQNRGSYYPSVDGAYFLCLNPQAKNLFYAPNAFEGQKLDMNGKFTASSKITESGYNLEVYVPLMGTTPLKLGESMGFEVSIDSFLDDESERFAYTNWQGIGAYWEEAAYLCEVVLVDMDEANGKYVESTNSSEFEENTTSSNSESIFDIVGGMCSSSLSSNGVFSVLLTALSVLVLNKKEIDLH